ncbi:UNVERIFIED_CONTAM: hypothetical protein RMT77_015551 [Armadillidium vulgare]
MAWDNKLYYIAILSLLSCVLFSNVEGCTCNMKHPQQHVCEADFVLAVRVRRPTTTSDGLTAYKIRVKRIFKISEKAQLALSKKVIYTIPGQCEVRLERKTSYVIAGDVEGGKPWISACSFAQPWRNLAPKMKKGIKLLYQTGCDCPIVSCHWWDRCPPGNFFCPWETTREEEDCQAKHGVCLRRPDGSCSWLGGRLYRTCMKSRTKSSKGLPNNEIVPTRFAKRRKKLPPTTGLKLDKSLFKI